MADQASTLRQTAQVMRMPPADTPKAVRYLRDRIDELEEENRRLMGVLTFQEPDSLRLSKTENVIFNLLKGGGSVPSSQIHEAIQIVNGSISEPKIVGVIITRLRKKLQGRYTVVAHWGVGYSLRGPK